MYVSTTNNMQLCSTSTIYNCIALIRGVLHSPMVMLYHRLKYTSYSYSQVYRGLLDIFSKHVQWHHSQRYAVHNTIYLLHSCPLWPHIVLHVSLPLWCSILHYWIPWIPHSDSCVGVLPLPNPGLATYRVCKVATEPVAQLSSGVFVHWPYLLKLLTRSQEG